MRVLCTVTASSSHVRAMLPLAAALAAAGHEVLVAAPARFAALFSGLPVTIAAIMDDPHEHVYRMMNTANPWLAVFAGSLLLEDFTTLLPAARDFGPDLIVRDGGELAGALVAEALGLPLVVAPSGIANQIDPAMLLPVLNERRAQLGLPPVAEPHQIYGFGRLDCMPPEYSFNAYPVFRTFAYRQPVAVDGGEALEVPETAGRPLVLASIGTVLPELARSRPAGLMLPPLAAKRFESGELINAIVAGLSLLDCAALVATGGIAADPPPPGGNVRIVDRFAQSRLLSSAALFVTHGGYNSIREAVAAGVPMVVLPRFGDQSANAARVQRLGLGEHLLSEEPQAIAAACRRLLDDAETLARVRQAQRRMLALPPVETIVADLERVALHGR